MEEREQISGESMRAPERPAEEAHEVRVTFNTPQPLPTVYANGIFGGIGPRGDLRCDFFYEHSTNPTEVVVVPGVRESFRGEIVRDILVRVILPITQLKAIAAWFQEKANAVEAMRPPANAEETEEEMP